MCGLEKKSISLTSDISFDMTLKRKQCVFFSISYKSTRPQPIRGWPWPANGLAKIVGRQQYDMTNCNLNHLGNCQLSICGVGDGAGMMVVTLFSWHLKIAMSC